MAVIMLLLGFKLFFGFSIMNSTASTIKAGDQNISVSDKSVEETLFHLEYRWSCLTVQEKLDGLQMIANHQMTLLGLPNELNVGADNLRGSKQGCYYDSTHEIIISLDSLLYDTLWEVVDTLCHEAFHSYEHRIAETYGIAGENYQNLMLFRNAAVYQQEFANYKDAQADFYGYYDQLCEFDARNYAQSAVREYREMLRRCMNIEKAD